MSWAKIFKSTWIQQFASWFTIILFVSLIINKIRDVMFSQPQLFLICVVAGSLSSALIFSIHAYLLSKKSFKKTEQIESDLSGFKKTNKKDIKILKNLILGLKNGVDNLNNRLKTIEDIEDKRFKLK